MTDERDEQDLHRVYRFEEERKARANGPEALKRLPFKQRFFADFDKLVVKDWVIKGLLAKGESSSWIGDPGATKSMLVGDLFIHLGAGRDWRGFKVPRAIGCVYFALERHRLVERRMKAQGLRDNLGLDLPISVVNAGGLDLLKPDCVGYILDLIKEAEDNFAQEVGLIAFDSYAKGIANGGGDEQSAKDQGFAANNMRKVLEKTNLHILGIGHLGKDKSRGERGSNARLADVDLVIEINGTAKIKTARIIKANDRDEGPLTSYEIEPIEIGRDPDHEPIIVYIVKADLIDNPQPETQPRQKLTPKQIMSLKCLADAILDHGISPPPAILRLPPAVSSVTTLDHWRDRLIDTTTLSVVSANPSRDFIRLQTQLAYRSLIGIGGAKFVWLINPLS